MAAERTRVSSASSEPVVARYVDTDKGFAELVKELLDQPLYALDTEFHRERTYYPNLALVQLGWPGKSAIVDPLAVDFAEFAPVLLGKGTAVVHAADQDLEVLENSCHCLPSTLFDTQLAAGFIGFSSPSLSSLVDSLLGIRLQKGDQLTDWTRRPLSESQLEYAASDVADLLDLHAVIEERLRARGRLQWAEAECAEMLARPRSALEPETAWWKLRQARNFHGKERGVAQQVAAWRERKAQAIDQPARFVISDLALASIAHRPPKNRDELAAVRNLDARHLSEPITGQILEAVAEGVALDPRRIVMPPGKAGESVAKPAVALVAAWVAGRARELEIDPAILATRADLVAFLKEPPEGRLADSWRHDLIGEPIERLASGEAALVLDGNQLVLEERSHKRIDEAPG